MANGEIYVSTRRAARNMSYQEMTSDLGKIDIVAELIGQDIMGQPLSAPFTCYDVSFEFQRCFPILFVMLRLKCIKVNVIKPMTFYVTRKLLN